MLKSVNFPVTFDMPARMGTEKPMVEWFLSILVKWIGSPANANENDNKLNMQTILLCTVFIGVLEKVNILKIGELLDESMLSYDSIF